METIESSDIAILDLLRRRDAQTVAQLAELMGVTATAVRLRLNRLMAQELIQRREDRHGRGRPTHYYSLTSAGRRKSGENFADLATALWEEIQAIEDPEVRKGLVDGIAKRLADKYSANVKGETVEEKMASVAELFGQRQIPLTVESKGKSAELTVLACPYPDLPDQHSLLCSMEQTMLSELIGEQVELNQCKRHGADCCKFESAKNEPSLSSEER